MTALNPAYQIQETVNYYQGDQPFEVRFVMSVENAPLGTVISFISLDYEPTIYLKPTAITSSPTFQAGVTVPMPAGAKFDFLLSLFRANAALPANIKIELSAYVVASGGTLAKEPLMHQVIEPPTTG